jgi:hypothetical protein
LTETPYQHHVLAIAAGSVFVWIDVSDYSNGAQAAAAVSALLDSIRIRMARDSKASERHLNAIRDLRIKPWDTVNPIKLSGSAVRDTERLRDRGFMPAVRVAAGFGELEISASANGSNVVIGTNSGYANSTDSGATFTAGAAPTPFGGITTRGDPSTGYGVTGSFYLSYIGNPAGGGAGANSFNGCTLPVAASTDGGATWNFRGNARQCSNNVSATSNCFADQEHIAADARNAGGSGTSVVRYSEPIRYTPYGGSTPRRRRAAAQPRAMVFEPKTRVSLWSPALRVQSTVGGTGRLRRRLSRRCRLSIIPKSRWDVTVASTP